jgi:hypothetical protein
MTGKFDEAPANPSIRVTSVAHCAADLGAPFWSARDSLNWWHPVQSRMNLRFASLSGSRPSQVELVWTRDAEATGLATKSTRPPGRTESRAGALHSSPPSCTRASVPGGSGSV